MSLLYVASYLINIDLMSWLKLLPAEFLMYLFMFNVAVEKENLAKGS